MTYSKNLPVFALYREKEQVGFSPFSLQGRGKKENNQVSSNLSKQNYIFVVKTK